MKIICILTAAFLLSGCASFQQAVDGGLAAGVVAVKAAEDTNIRIWTANACGTPLSAAIRHPEIVPALRALCLPAGAQSSPVILLEGQR